MGLKVVEYIHLAHYIAQWRPLKNMVTNFRLLYNALLHCRLCVYSTHFYVYLWIDTIIC
jgi:hypothetical protein